MYGHLSNYKFQECFVPGECVGDLIGAFDLTNPEDCLGKCEATLGCTWFTHHTRDNFCALYSNVDRVEVDRCPSCVSGEGCSGCSKIWDKI